MRAEVYRNLHTGTWSIRDLGVGRVVDHPMNVIVKDALFVVRPAGREKVRSEKRKNVHAFIKGHIISTNLESFDYTKWHKATYNPYVNDTFVDVETGEPVLQANLVSLSIENGVYYK